MGLIGLEINDSGIIAAGGSPPKLLDLDGQAQESPGFFDVAPLVQGDLRRLADNRVGVSAYGVDDRIDFKFVLTARDR